MEVVVASSSVDANIACWDFNSGAELLRYKSCASPNHGLVSVGDRFIASSQTSGSVKYWAWSKVSLFYAHHLFDEIPLSNSPLFL